MSNDIRMRLRDARKREHAALMEILEYLRQVDRLRLFSEWGFKSLFEYAVKELYYSEAEAYHRIQAMRIVSELPEIQEDVTAGNLSLTSLTVAGTLFRAEAKAEPMAAQRKLEVLKAMRGKSGRESEIIAREYSNQPKAEKVNLEFEMKIARVKGLLAHSHPGISTDELFEKLCDDFIKQHEKKMTVRTSRLDGNSAAPKGRSIAIAVKREVWQRDRGRCTNCGGQHALEYDHIVPVAQNGQSSAENLRLLCRNCNQRAAIVKLGPKTMERYLT